MPKFPKVSVSERRTWLLKSEEGQSIAAIAREAGRGIRSVRDNIERARQERQHEQIRSELLKEAYMRHNNDLLGVAKLIHDVASDPNPRGLLEDVDQRPATLIESLHEHISTWRVWKAWKRWNAQAKAMDDARRAMMTVVRPLVNEAKKSYPEIEVDAWLKSMVRAVEEEILGRDMTVWTYAVQPVQKGRCVYWGPERHADPVSTESRAHEIIERHKAVWVRMRKLLYSGGDIASPDRLKRAMTAWDEARQVIQQEMDVLEIRGVVPGDCGLCPGVQGRPRKAAKRARRNNR